MESLTGSMFVLCSRGNGRTTGRAFAGGSTAALLEDVAGPPSAKPRVYVCGPNAFVEAAAGWLVEIGHDPGRIRTERFGPTGT